MRHRVRSKRRHRSRSGRALSLDRPMMLRSRLVIPSPFRHVVIGDRVPDNARTNSKPKTASAPNSCERGRRQRPAHVVERWNHAPAAGRGALWSLTIRCALTAGTPWLDVYCPGCRTSRAVDIRALDRHPLASVGSLVLGLRCLLCPVWHRYCGLHVAPPAVSLSAAKERGA